jgi:hypothetical protein
VLQQIKAQSSKLDVLYLTEIWELKFADTIIAELCEHFPHHHFASKQTPHKNQICSQNITNSGYIEAVIECLTSLNPPVNT